MSNVALGKPIEEPIKSPLAATDGNASEYSGYSGYAEFSWPYMMTIDLGALFGLSCIRLLLWDGLGEGNKQRSPRIYKYRLLTSADHQLWKVIYDSSMKEAMAGRSSVSPTRWKRDMSASMVYRILRITSSR